MDVKKIGNIEQTDDSQSDQDTNVSQSPAAALTGEGDSLDVAAKPNYFSGRFLSAQDLQQEQEYQKGSPEKNLEDPESQSSDSENIRDEND